RCFRRSLLRRCPSRTLRHTLSLLSETNTSVSQVPERLARPEPQTTRQDAGDRHRLFRSPPPQTLGARSLSRDAAVVRCFAAAPTARLSPTISSRTWSLLRKEAQGSKRSARTGNENLAGP